MPTTRCNVCSRQRNTGWSVRAVCGYEAADRGAGNASGSQVQETKDTGKIAQTTVSSKRKSIRPMFRTVI